MNISLRQVKTDASQTMFITSTGTVLFTSYLTRDQYGHRATTRITSFDDQGSIIQVGHIKWNDTTESWPAVYVRTGLIALQTIGQDNVDAYAMVFRKSDGQVCTWKQTNDILLLFADRASVAPIAVACDDVWAGECVILCIQPTGFHLLDEIVATFILFERLCRRSRAHDARSPLRESIPSIHLLSCPNNRVPPVSVCEREDNTGRHVPQSDLGMWRRNRHLTRSTADLTGELVRRYNYPSAYGGFGDIWKCDWLKDSRVIEVAVKVTRTNVTGGQNETQSKKISRELKVWVRLEHECLLPLYGISFDFGTFPAMVCPWLEGGTLGRYLEHHQELQLGTRLQLLSNVADGLQYLHVCGIIHGDLTGSNVLIKDNGKACLSDFGLSRILMEATGGCYLTSTVRGSVRWAAPELFEVDSERVQVLPNTQSDIYSFGSTMLQVLTGKVPYHYYKYDAQVLVALSRGVGPARPDEPAIDDVHWEFMQWCWSSSQSERRPSIGEVVDFLSVATSRC